MLQHLIKSCTIPLSCALGRRWVEFSLLYSGRAEVSFSDTESRNKGYEMFNRILHLPLTSVFSGSLLRKTLLVSCLRIKTEEHWGPKLILLGAYCVLDIVHSLCFTSSQPPPFCNRRKSRLRAGIRWSWSLSSWEAELEFEIKLPRLQSPCSGCHSMDLGKG